MDYECQEKGCNKVFALKTLLKNHVTSDHGRFLCLGEDLCLKSFSSITNWKKHLTNKHQKFTNGQTCYDRKECHQKVFNSVEELNRHLTGKPHNYKTCNQCNEVFACERNRKFHVKKHASKNKKRCRYCQRKFTKEELENHQKSCLQGTFLSARANPSASTFY